MLSNSERKQVLCRIAENIVDSFVHFGYHRNTQRSEDGVYEYGRQLLSVGLFYLEYSDAVREGDGERVFRCWRYLLPIFKSSGRTNYSIEALSTLYQYQYQLTPRQSAELMWSRFINIHGVRGRNIPCDLHQEHLNRICKTAIGNLGVNKTEVAIKRAANTLGTLSPLLHQYDSQNHVQDTCGSHHSPSSERDRDRIVSHLLQSEIFSSHPTRLHHRSFPRPRNVLHDLDHDKVCKW